MKTAAEVAAEKAAQDAAAVAARAASPGREITMTELKEMFEGIVKEAVKPLTKVDRRWGAFPGMSEEDVNKLSYLEKFGKFIKSLAIGRVQEANAVYDEMLSPRQKALTEATDTAGGYLVPEEFYAEVLRLIPQFGLARRLCRAMPMTTEIMRVPKQTSSVSVTWPGEAAAGTAVSPVLGQVVLTAKKAVGLAALSNELLADSGVPVIQYLQTIFAEQFGLEEDNQWFNGTGSPFVGLLNVSGTNVKIMATGDTTFAKVTIDYLIQAMDQVVQEADADTVFLFHKNIMNQLRQQKVGTTYALMPASQGMPGTIVGVPWYTSKKLPGTAQSAISTNFVIYGNPRFTLFGDRGQMTVAVGTEGLVGSDNLFQQDMRALRITERIAINVALPEAYGILQTAAS